jgi:hypothetical protein
MTLIYTRATVSRTVNTFKRSIAITIAAPKIATPLIAAPSTTKKATAAASSLAHP